MSISSVTLADISQRYYSFARQIEPNVMPALDDIKVEHSQNDETAHASEPALSSDTGEISVSSAPDSGRGNLVDTYA